MALPCYTNEFNSKVEAKLKSSSMRIGIFFGGPSREREVSFAGGRTVYDNLDKELFTPVPIFVDSLGQMVLLEWEFVYKGTIRDFYPPADMIPSDHEGQFYIESFPHLAEKAISKIGTPVALDELPNIIDFAFLALHGRYGEDGTLQSELEKIGLPYSGSGVMACAIGMDKYAQKKLMAAAGFNMPEMSVIYRSDWLKNPTSVLSQLQSLGIEKAVIRPAKQGSSIGVSIIDHINRAALTDALNAAFFIEVVHGQIWHDQSLSEKQQWAQNQSDVKTGLGYPIVIEDQTYLTPKDLLSRLEQLSTDQSIHLYAVDSEAVAILESFIEGREFSCIVVRNTDGRPLALPPTEIVKQGQLFDYRAKYLPGLSRKETPISLADEAIEKIRSECEKLYDLLGFGCYARIDGFYTHDDKVILNDPNTTSGMLPSSFFFHQAAEIGMNPSQFLTYIIHASLQERQNEFTILNSIDQQVADLEKSLKLRSGEDTEKTKVAVIFGGYSFERHISVESGRNIYEKLASSSKYEPTPVFLKGDKNGYQLVELPLNYMLKDNADDIRDKIDQHDIHPVIQGIRQQASALTSQFAGGCKFDPEVLPMEHLGSKFDVVFIALHGRPGEDGDLQFHLEKMGLPYNGSNSEVSSVTINKFDTLQLLGSHHLPTTDQWVVDRADFHYDPERWVQSIEGKFGYPLIAKPVDDGCSSAVIKIQNQSQLNVYLSTIFRQEDQPSEDQRKILGLSWNEEFPKKDEVLIERLIDRGDEVLFMEITCGLLTSYNGEQLDIQIFEPSEALATGDVLSLEEKFLAGQGQNLTPARLHTDQYSYDYLSDIVKSDLKTVAEILGIEGYARIDAFVKVYENGQVETIVIEVNSLPGMTPATCIYHQAALEGMKPYDFIDKILTFAQERQQKLES